MEPDAGSVRVRAKFGRVSELAQRMLPTMLAPALLLHGRRRRGGRRGECNFHGWTLSTGVRTALPHRSDSLRLVVAGVPIAGAPAITFYCSEPGLGPSVGIS